MSDPTAIEIPTGETEKVIETEDVDPEIGYLLEVDDAAVRFAHQKPQASRGAELRPGQTHKLKNFRGEGLFLHAPDAPATVRVRPAGADVDTQPENSVTIESVELGSGIATEDNQTEVIDLLEEQISLLTQIEENTR